MWGIIERGRRGGYGRSHRDRVLLLLAEETSHRYRQRLGVSMGDGDGGSNKAKDGDRDRGSLWHNAIMTYRDEYPRITLLTFLVYLFNLLFFSFALVA
jgi:hypothetical protein